MGDLPPIDRAGLLVLLAPLALLAVVAAATLVRLWRRPDDARRRSLIRATLLAAPVLAGAWLWFAPRSLEVEQWSCRVCALEEIRLSWNGTRLLGLESHFHGAEEARRYHGWFESTAENAHVHDWTGDGALPVGTEASCQYSIGARPFYSGLPVLPDDIIAQRLLQRLVEAPPEHRHDLMRDFEIDGYVPNPVRLVAYEGPMEEAAFRAQFLDWLEEHPMWR